MSRRALEGLLAAVAARLPLPAELRGGVSAGRVRARPPGFIRGAAVRRARAAARERGRRVSGKKDGQVAGVFDVILILFVVYLLVEVACIRAS